jgi:hypothetical protein
MVWGDVLEVTFQGREGDPFRAYYEAASTSDEAFRQAPHYQFASIMKFEDLAVFLQRFGFPVYDGGKDIVLGEFLIEAKKLHLAMKAWGSVTQQDWACARESLEELRFACHPDAHWYFWPAPICDLSGVAEAHELMTLKDRFMQLMEQERPNASWLVGSTEWETDVIRSWKVFGVSDHAAAEQVAQARQARLKALRPSEVLTECVRQIESLCVEPLKLWK